MTALTITDLFCGAGGSGLGAHAAGYDLKLAANHWAKAIETHAANFPDTEHDCADISQVDPRRYPATDVLWASPECTNHSQAKGRKRAVTGQPDLFGETLPDEAAERSRATMWDVPRFAEAMLLRGRPYRAVVVENVVEASKWIPFRAWLAAMEALGYGHQIVSLNSMHAQAINAPRAPQSRDRMYVVFHRAGQRRPDVAPRPAAWCERCAGPVAAVQAWKNGRTVGRYRAQYLYVCPAGHAVAPAALPAAAAIDWTMPGQRIGDRDKPLSAKTMARIEAGLRKYSGRALTFEARGNTFVRVDEHGRPVYARAWPVDQPTATFTTTETRALVVPVEGRDGKQAASVMDPMRTQSTRAETALVVPYYGNSTSAASTGEPIGALTTRDRYALVVPSGGTWREDARHSDEPFSTVTTRETDGVAFIAELRGGSSDHRPVDEPLATVVASGNHHMLVRHNGEGGGQPGWQCTSATEPMRTLTTGGHQSVVSIEPLVEDATFRMLEPHEIQAAMAFTTDYRVLGNRREKVRQLGNGVTPPAAEFLLRAVATSLDGAA
jgi:DNA (cytosine-5)-methyltransferase 1